MSTKGNGKGLLFILVIYENNLFLDSFSFDIVSVILILLIF